MNFTIKFSSTNNYSIDFKYFSVGVLLVDRIRQEAGVDLPLERINGAYQRNNVDPTIEIPEIIARNSGHFEEVNGINVTVQRGSLNSFMEEKIVFERDTQTSEIRNASVQFELNSNALINAWIEAGYPKVWPDLTNTIR